MSVARSQRFRRSFPCPICGGFDEAPRGHGVRCWGYLSDDAMTAFCTNNELAGELREAGRTGTFPHRLAGDCACGQRHDPRPVPVKNSAPRKPIKTTTYDVRDIQGRLVAQHVRQDFQDGSKSFTWKRDGRFGLAGLPVIDLPLFGIHEVPPEGSLVVVEGEKARQTLKQRGIAAVATACGAKATPSDDTLRPLLGHPVHLWPDNDDDGQAHMARIAERLVALGHTRISWVVWPEAPPKGDAADFLDSDIGLKALLDSAVPYVPSPPGRNGSHPQEPPHLTDVGNAQRLVARHGQDFRYCYALGRYLVWDGRRWTQDDTGKMQAWAKETALSIYLEAARVYREAATLEGQGLKEEAKQAHSSASDIWRWARSSEAAPRIAAMQELAKSEPGIPVTPDQLDADPWLLNVLNGTLNLQTGELQPHEREDLITKVAPVDYDPKATFPLWERFISEAIPNPDTRSYVQRCAGASLAGIQRDDLIILVHGQGGTGKSTFREALSAALGEYAGVADLKTFATSDNPHSASPDLARLRGLRMVVVSEVTGSVVGPLSLLKQVTGGDKIQARFLFGQPFEFVPTFTLWLVGNERPRVSDTDSGIWRRLREVPFTTRFAETDPDIRPTLKSDPSARSAILRWALEGCLTWQQQGLGQPPEQIVAATAAYRTDMDPIVEWLDECTAVVATAFTLYAELLASYLEWAKANNVRRPLGRKAFAQRLAERYVPERRHAGRGFVGVGLLADPQIQSDVSEKTRKAEFPIVSYENLSHVETIGNQGSQLVTPDTDQIQPPTVTPDTNNHDFSANQRSCPADEMSPGDGAGEGQGADEDWGYV